MKFELDEEVEVEKMQPEDAVEILRKYGTEVSTQQAIIILDFLRMLANIAAAQYLRNENS